MASARASRGMVAAMMGSTSRPPGASRSASTSAWVSPMISVRKLIAARPTWPPAIMAVTRSAQSPGTVGGPGGS